MRADSASESYHLTIKMVKRKTIRRLTKVSASRKTHFSYWVRFQQWIFVKVMPSSGRCSSAKCAASPESRTSTNTTSANTALRRSLRTEVWSSLSTSTNFYFCWRDVQIICRIILDTLAHTNNAPKVFSNTQVYNKWVLLRAITVSLCTFMSICMYVCMSMW